MAPTVLANGEGHASLFSVNGWDADGRGPGGKKHTAKLS